MPFLYIAAYCALVVVVLVALTLREEWRDENRRVARLRKKFVVINGGKARRAKLHRSA